MSEQSTEHATFVIEQTYPEDPARVFRAFASAEEKSKWFGPPASGSDRIELDFRDGYRYSALYYDIVPAERIVYTYEMFREQDRLSVSVSSIELRPAGDGTALTYTEQGVFLDGHDGPGPHEHGTRIALERIAEALAS